MRALRCVLITTFLSWCALQGHAVAKSSSAYSYATDNLANIAAVIGLEKIAPEAAAVSDTVLFFDLGGKPARADVRRGLVRHIGYRVFPDAERSLATLPVFDFLERFALEQELPIEQPNVIERDKVRFTGIKASELPSLFSRQLPFTVSTEEFKDYRLCWTASDGRKMEVVVPISYNLLNGSELPENERRLIADLSSPEVLNHPDLPIERSVGKENLEATPKLNCYVLRGSRFFTEYINSDRYYQNNTDSLAAAFRVLDNEAYPAESISNMLSGLDIPNDIEVQLKMIVYPMEKKIFSIPLRQMVAYFLSQGCEIYTGLTGIDNQKADYVMIGRNDRRGYCHSLKISVPISAINEKKGRATAKITPYIPLPKILNMFAE